MGDPTKKSSLLDISLDALFDCGRDGMSVVAEDENGSLVSIRDVPRGLACKCTCPGCGRQMVARKGEEIAHHFAHAGAVGLTCTSAGETALHKFAKQMLNERLEVGLPLRSVEEAGEKEVVVPAGTYEFDTAILEKKTGAIVPDVVLLKGERKLIIEFKVTHECGPEKIAEIRRLDIAAIEIDLSPYRQVKLGDLADKILFEAGRDWLHNPKDRDARSRARLRAADKAAAIEKEATNFAAGYRHAPPTRIVGSSKQEKSVQSYGLVKFININVNGSGCFNVTLAQWQAAVLSIYLGPDDVDFGFGEAYLVIEELGWINKAYLAISREVAKAVQRKITTFQMAPYAVRDYLKHLGDSGLLVPTQHDGWRASPALRKVIAAAKELRERPAKRFDDLEACVRDVLKELPAEEVETFDLKAWADQILPGRDYSPMKALYLDDTPWRYFRSDLVDLRWKIRSRPEDAVDLMGMPLSGELARSLEKKAKEQADREEAKVQKEQAAADSRVSRLKSQACQGLGGEADGWFSTPRPELDNRIPVEVAAISDDEYVRASRLLSKRIREFELARAKEQRKGAALGDVFSFARTKLGEEGAGYWIRGVHPRLRARPEDYIVDEATRDVCLKLLDPKINLTKFGRKRA